MPKVDTLHQLERALSCRGNEIDMLRRNRAQELIKWERTCTDVEQRLLQWVRGVREQGIDKLTNAWWGQVARVTQLQMLIKGQYGRALIYSEEQISQLANDIVNNPKLSDLAPISLVPQVTVNFDEIKKKLDNVEIKVEQVQVTRPVPLELEQPLPLTFALLENNKWQWPFVIGTHNEHGIELMNELLTPFRSHGDLPVIEPMRNKWRYGMLPMGDTFSRCAFRVYEREDDSLNQVLVIFLDDARRYPRWTRVDNVFYRIPPAYHFSAFPAFTYHIWLGVTPSHEWGQYGAPTLPVPVRNRIRELITQYKTYDAAVPDVNCTVVLKSNRGKKEPWAYEGDIFMASPQSTESPDCDASNRNKNASLATFVGDMAVESDKVKCEAELDSSTSASAVAPVAASTAVDVKKTDEVTNPKLAPIKYDYKMDIEERWRTCYSLDTATHPYEEDGGWPLGWEFEQCASLREMITSFAIDEWMDIIPLDVVKAYCFELLGFGTELDRVQLESRLLRERILWEVNGHHSLQSRLIMIEQGSTHEQCINAFQMPCQVAKCYKQLDSLRYDKIPIKGATAGDDTGFEEADDDEEEEDQVETALVTCREALKQARLVKCRLPQSYEEISNSGELTTEELYSEKEDKDMPDTRLPSLAAKDSIGSIDSLHTDSVESLCAGDVDDEDLDDHQLVPESVEANEELVEKSDLSKVFLDSPTESDIETFNVYGDKPSPMLTQANNHARSSSSTHAAPIQRHSVPSFGDSDYRPQKRRTTPRASNQPPPPPSRGSYRHHQRQDGFQSDCDYNSGKRNRNGHNYIKNYGRQNPDRQVFIKPRNYQSDYGGRSEDESSYYTRGGGGQQQQQASIGWGEPSSSRPFSRSSNVSRSNDNYKYNMHEDRRERQSQPQQRKPSPPPPLRAQQRERSASDRWPKSRPVSACEQLSEKQNDRIEQTTQQQHHNGGYNETPYCSMVDGRSSTRKTKETDLDELPLPGWGKTGATALKSNANLFALVKGISTFSKEEVRELFEYCQPLSIEACGNEWRLLFDSKDTMEQSFWTDGTTVDLDEGQKSTIKVEINTGVAVA